MIERLKQALHAADGYLLRVRDSLTPGQRWTAGLAVALAVLVLFFGLPTDVRVLPGSANEAAAAQEPPPDDGKAPPSAPPSPSVSPAEEAPAAGPPPALATDSPPAVPDTPAVHVPGLPLVTALVRAGGGLPGRDDAAVANAFLARADFDASLVETAGDAAATCARAGGRGRVVLAGLGVGEELRRCLVDRGAALVAFDALGDRPPDGGGQVVSTRRGVTSSLVDLGRWGVSSRALVRREIGLVAGAAARSQIEPSIRAWRRLGIDVGPVAWIGDGPSVAEISEGTRRFAAAGVDVVVFAVAVDVQRRWGIQQSLLLPDVRYVVSDAFDAVVDEAYPPLFEGALAHTSLRVPWFARTRGETETQVACRRTWEEVSGRTLSATEQVNVFAWCQHVKVVESALGLVQSGAPLGRALRSARVPSPLTSDLAPLPDGGYGPAADAVLVWRSECSCWRPSRQFTPRR